MLVLMKAKEVNLERFNKYIYAVQSMKYCSSTINWNSLTILPDDEAQALPSTPPKNGCTSKIIAELARPAKLLPSCNTSWKNVNHGLPFCDLPLYFERSVSAHITSSEKSNLVLKCMCRILRSSV